MERRWSRFLSLFKKKSRGGNGKVSYGEEESSGSKAAKPSVQEQSSSAGSGSSEPSHQMSFGLASVFPYQELKEATNNFDSSRVLGGGGYGRVYSGDLRGRTVAIKKLYDDNPKLLEQFFNEVTILSRIRHKNLVTLHGCSNPHTRELLLVYEFVPNGTVADHLHGERPLLTWATRIQIAVETAEALVYLHALEPPVIHRDVKTSNILLDEAFHVKVADLGICRLLPWDTTQVSTLPQGTMGYRDPEYERLFKLTDKTDVYSFGVVLLELISGKEAVDVNRAPDNIYLDGMAVDMIINKKLKEFVDPKLGYQSDSEVKRMIDSVAELAQRCLLPEGKMRPRMVRVLTALKEIRDGTQHIHDGNRELEVVDGEARVFSHEEELRATKSLSPSQDPEHIKDEAQHLEGKDSEQGEADNVGGFSEAYTFSHEELHVATNSFDSSRDLEHGSGKVFHGKLKDGRMVVVKKINERFLYLSAQLSKEVPAISCLRHENLVTLYGCTAPRVSDMFLVYEYAPNCGTLDYHLHGPVAGQPDYELKKNIVALSWSARIQIAIQTAEALSYLHSLEPPILHTDVTTSNILIDDKFHVKVIGLDIFVRFTALRGVGTRGYVDPDYKKSWLYNLITDKSDVYSFGVVLLELTLGKRAYDEHASWGNRCLTDIVLNKIENKELDQLVDVKLDYHSNSETKRMVTLVSELACRCLQPVGNLRPRMAEVLSVLKEIGMEDPDAEVVALSPKTLLATNRYICEVCHKGFQRDQNLQLHRRGHNLPWKLKQRSTTEVKKRVYVCPEVTCTHHDPSRALGDLTGIKKHFSRKHGEKKWKCDKCSKRYAVQSDWKAHAKICGTKEYRCDCGTIFSRKDSFVTHRAFCDALAEENYRVNHGLASMVGNLQGQGQELFSHSVPSLHSGNTDTMMNSSNSDPNMNNSFKSLSLNSFIPNNSGMVFSPNAPRNSSLQLGGSSSYMSATALLQKATEMGARVSDDSISPILLRGFTGYSTTSRPTDSFDEIDGSYMGNQSSQQMNSRWTNNEVRSTTFQEGGLAMPPLQLRSESHDTMLGLDGQMQKNGREEICEGRDARMTQDFLGLGPVGNANIADPSYVESEVGLGYSDSQQQNQHGMYPYHQMEKPMWDI